MAGRPRPPPSSTTASAYASSTECAALMSITHIASTVCRGVSSTAEYAAICVPRLVNCMWLDQAFEIQTKTMQLLYSEFSGVVRRHMLHCRDSIRARLL